MNGNPDYELKQPHVKEQKKVLNGKKKDIKARWGDHDKGAKIVAAHEKAAKDLINMDPTQIQSLIDEGKDLEKDLSEANDKLVEMDKGSKKERSALADADVYDLSEQRKSMLQEADKDLYKLDEEVEIMKNQLEAAKKNGGDNLEKVESELGELEQNIDDAIRERDAVQKEFDILLDKVHQHDLFHCDLPHLEEVIDGLNALSGKLNGISDKVKNLHKGKTLLQAKLGGLDSQKKLGEIKGLVGMQRATLAKIGDDINLLYKLANEMNGYASNEDESGFIEGLIEELAIVKEKVTECEEVCTEIEKDTDRIEKQVADQKAKGKDMSNDELVSLIEKIESIATKAKQNGQHVEGLERVVHSKKQRFADMDMARKYNRRGKECVKLQNLAEDRKTKVTDLESEIK